MKPSVKYCLLILATYIYTSHGRTDPCNILSAEEPPYVEKCYTNDVYDEQPGNDACPDGMHVATERHQMVYQVRGQPRCTPQKCTKTKRYQVHTLHRCDSMKCHFICRGDKYTSTGDQGHPGCKDFWICADMPKTQKPDRQCIGDVDDLDEGPLYWREDDLDDAESARICSRYNGDWGKGKDIKTYTFTPSDELTDRLTDKEGKPALPRYRGSWIMCRSGGFYESMAVKHLVCRSSVEAIEAAEEDYYGEYYEQQTRRDDAFIEYENELDNLLSDYAYDVAIETARRDRAIVRLQNEKKKILRSNKKIHKLVHNN